jgi:hypothetical protein
VRLMSPRPPPALPGRQRFGSGRHGVSESRCRS